MGYTLLEIIIVLAIIAILTTLAVTNYSDQISHQQLRDASSGLVGQLRLARQKAISSGTKETISFNPQLRQYSDVSLGTQTTLPGNVDFGDITFVGNSATFRSDGTGEMGTLYLTNSKNESVKITVNITGRVRKFLWNGQTWE